MPKKPKHIAVTSKLQCVNIAALPCGGYVVESASSSQPGRFACFVAAFSTSAELLAWLGENIAST